MSKRPPVLLACLVFGALGLISGLADVSRLIAFPIARLGELEKLPRPHSVTWVAGLRPFAGAFDVLERPITALAVVLLICAFPLLGALLNPEFRLLKRPEENPGTGFASHVDLVRLLRVGTAVLLSLWLVGALAPLGTLFARPGRGGGLLPMVFAGIPAWAGLFQGALSPIFHSVLLLGLLWLIWGPGGLAGAMPEFPLVRTLLWGVLAGAAAVPAVLALYIARYWIQDAAQAFSLADRGGWTALIALSLALPTAAGAYLGFHASLFRPRAVRPVSLAAAAVAALLVMLLTWQGVRQVRQALGGLDVGRMSLARRLSLPQTPFLRYALILTPRGRALYSTPQDGSFDPVLGECVACDASEKRVEQYLEDRSYRTQLAFRAFVHLHDCASLNWLSTRSLEVSLKMLERAPSPIAAELLMEKLADCPITPENRRVLDALADPARFRWPREMAPQWLGAAYLRFGDLKRAREYLMNSGLPEAQLRQMLGGISLLTDGTVRGTVTIQGKPVYLTRVGLVRVDRRWRTMIGGCRPFEWRKVSAVAHTDRQGRFQFRNIPEGRYLLVVTGGDIGRADGQPVVTNHPRVIELHRFQPALDLPPIDIRFIERPRLPRDDGSSTTAFGGGNGPASREEMRKWVRQWSRSFPRFPVSSFPGAEGAIAAARKPAPPAAPAA